MLPKRYHSPSTPAPGTPRSDAVQVEARTNLKSFPGSCYCHEIEYAVELENPESDARTSICYCQNCRVRFTLTPDNSTKVTQ